MDLHFDRACVYTGNNNQGKINLKLVKINDYRVRSSNLDLRLSFAPAEFARYQSPDLFSHTARKKLEQVNYRKDFWCRYRVWLVSYWPIFSLSLVTVPEAFVNVNSAQFPTRFESGILQGRI